MSRASWSSIGSDAEVQHHFDQPSDHDPRLCVNRNGNEQDKRFDDDGYNDTLSSHGTEAESVEGFFDSVDATSADSPHAPPAPSATQYDFLDDDADHQSNQAICRICLESAASDGYGGESLGRLLSPCRCKGTMKYVHATCLDQWRAASARSLSAVACDQCGAPYRFRKSKFVGLATSPTLLFIVSLFLFLLLIWTTGVVATFFMDIYDQPAATEPSRSSQKAKPGSWWPWRASVLDHDTSLASVESDAWSHLDADYTPGLWSYSNLMYEPAAYAKLIKQAVRSFASGEAVDAVREVVGLQDVAEAPQIEQQEPQEERGFWSSLKYEWMYGDGGLWEKKASSPSPAALPSQDASTSHSGSADAHVTQSKARERYDARAALDVNDKNAKERRRKKTATKTRRSKPSQIEPQGWLNKLLVQFSVGFSLVGIISFVNLLVGASFIGPINLHNFGLGRSFARMTSGGRGRNTNQDGVSIASILIVLLVVIGVVRALHVVYKLVRKGARRGLSKLEDVIVDWNYEGDADGATGDVVAATSESADQVQ
ncbi:hypothetical protein EX895_000487 [Sporisorium graminicola]|uniref:RING-CH-type domain-containing protein n=1 Tax=Sporisorium graminicola TaxID=280036 RepID=A0A4V6EUN9_9BASI|nr:hypothetical protein EX895_000487 [Sporisorium graminicola]TKY90489.1 hypothetical protein EX895_000487 [Sporisorium graminicola]